MVSTYCYSASIVQVVVVYEYCNNGREGGVSSSPSSCVQRTISTSESLEIESTYIETPTVTEGPARNTHRDCIWARPRRGTGELIWADVAMGGASVRRAVGLFSGGAVRQVSSVHLSLWYVHTAISTLDPLHLPSTRSNPF